jgi:hypothetical protein
MNTLLDEFLASVENSQANETVCGKYAPPPAPFPFDSALSPTSRTDCKWTINMSQDGADMSTHSVTTKEGCCGICWADPKCKAAEYNPRTLQCHLKETNQPVTRNGGSLSCVALKDIDEAKEYWADFD